MEILGIQFDYTKGSLWDKLAEAYAGTHDTLNSIIWYDKLGNGKDLDGTGMALIGKAANNANVLFATPFAASVLLPPELWNAINAASRLK
jgi:filamentous hemagglutinin